MIDLGRLLSAGALSPLDVRFAETLIGLVGEDEPALRLAAALASRAVQRGHVCADLERLATEPLLNADGVAVATPEEIHLAVNVEALRRSPLVSDGSSRTPLVLDGAARLYLYRYFDYERRLANALRRRATIRASVDEPLLERGLERLFPEDNEQRSAASTAVRHKLAVISGGPGTGKTTTVAAILALIVEQAQASGERSRIELVAPTGKAAQRMAESVAGRADKLELSDATRSAIPRDASTIHRALGYLPRTPTRFRHARQNPLGVDVLLADEASMIDLALMTKMVEAVPDSAHLILLGDKNQLASVEAGAVLADMWDAPALASNARALTKSYRFADSSGIAQLARAISAGEADRALEILRGEQSMPYGEVALMPPVEHADLPEHLARTATLGFADLFADLQPHERLSRVSRFRILCAHRRGVGGAQALNAAIERHLQSRGIIRERALFYDGRPILITANDHQLSLFNGDIGVVCRRADGTRRAFFPGADAHHPRAFPVGRLPAHETVFAMTVHKSQGSEVDRIAVVLPPAASPILTRELLYTAVTRARTHVDILSSEAVLRAAIHRRIERASGLASRLTAPHV